MKKIRFKELSFESFMKYGSFTDLKTPKETNFGNKEVCFYPDLLQQNLGNSKTASFSVCHIVKSDHVIIKSSEFHNFCNETIMPLNGDILMHIAPVTDKEVLQTNKIEVFRIPALTLVTVRPGVWHHIPFTYCCDSADIMVVLPERTYINDCHLYMIPEGEFIEVIQ